MAIAIITCETSSHAKVALLRVVRFHSYDLALGRSDTVTHFGGLVLKWGVKHLQLVIRLLGFLRVSFSSIRCLGTGTVLTTRVFTHTEATLLIAWAGLGPLPFLSFAAFSSALASVGR